MKCLTVCEPFASFLVFGPKRIENRSWATKYRGPIVIHAGKSKNWLNSQLPAGFTCPPKEELNFGKLVGVMDLFDCLPFEGMPFDGDVRNDPWAFGPWCWLLRNPRPVEKIAITGATYLFDVPDKLVNELASIAG